MIRYKSFLLSKLDDVALSQDSLGVNAEAGLYAVADGVSNSYHPEYVARALCRLFTELQDKPFDDWDGTCHRDIFPAMQEKWVAQVEEYVASLTPFNRRLEALRAERWHTGASTFCGIAVDEAAGRLDFAVLGDSTLFIVGDDGDYAAFCTSPTDIDDEGRPHVDYSSSTHAVVSDGTLSGEWRIGSAPLRAGFVVLLTDAMSKWFQQLHYVGEHPEHILMALETQDDFSALAKEWRERGEMADDLAVIILRIGEGAETVVVQAENAAAPQMLPSLRLEVLLPDFLTAKASDVARQKTKGGLWVLRKIADFFNLR